MESEELINNSMVFKKKLPNSSGVLAMGIISLVSFTCCIPSGMVGLTLAILAVVLGNKAIFEYQNNPVLYTQQSLKNVKAGKVCGIIGLCFGGLWLLGVIIYLSIFGFVFGAISSFFPWHHMCF